VGLKSPLGCQPTTWDETLRRLPLYRSNRLGCRLGQDGKGGRQDFRWVEDVLLGEHQTNVILSGEITAEMATLYAYLTHFSNLSPARVAVVVNRGGRERHLIEDTFNTQKNNGIGWEHVFCAQAAASKNCYLMMQVAQVLWIIPAAALCNDSMTGRGAPPSKGWLAPSGKACERLACRWLCRPWARSVSASPNAAAQKTSRPIPLTV
jgi:hypothetical protein